MNPSKNSFTQVQSATEGIPNELVIFVSIAFILFIMYVIYRVRKSLRDDLK
jgi:hypothetical protein